MVRVRGNNKLALACVCLAAVAFVSRTYSDAAATEPDASAVDVMAGAGSRFARRHLGGGDSGFVLSIGALMGTVAIVTVVFALCKQSSIVAFMVVGVIGHYAGIDADQKIMGSFSTVGIILLLFMAGLEVEVHALKKQLKAVLLIGLGQICLNTLFGIVMALILNAADSSYGLDNGLSIVYFGLCMTFSSTIAVLGMLKKKGEMESLHGQVCLGLLVLQDITAVLALAILSSTQDTSQDLSLSLVMLFVKMFGLGAILFFLAVGPGKLLDKFFRLICEDAELLFIGTLAWALGIAGAGAALDFSPEISAFMAGVSLTVLPFKLEIEDKVESIKNFGVMVFFVSLGLGLELNGDTLKVLPAAFIFAFLILLGTMPMITLLSHIAKVKSTPAFMIGGIVNQISEFSLILASICNAVGVFSDKAFMAITMACVVTLIISGVGHEMLGTLHFKFGKHFRFLDRRSLKVKDNVTEREKGHIVVFGYNEFVPVLEDYAKKVGRPILLVDLDADTLNPLEDNEVITPVFADMFDSGTWEHVRLDHALLCVSCVDGSQGAEVAIAKWLKHKKAPTCFLAATTKGKEALELYEVGVHYVIQSDDLAAKRLHEIFDDDDLSKIGKKAHAALTKTVSGSPQASPKALPEEGEKAAEGEKAGAEHKAGEGHGEDHGHSTPEEDAKNAALFRTFFKKKGDVHLAELEVQRKTNKMFAFQ